MSDEALCVWVTGPGRASMETIARELARRLAARGQAVELFDAGTPGIASVDAAGIGFVAGALARHGVTSVVALPADRAARERARHEVGRLIEVHVDEAGTPGPPGYEPPEHAEVEVVVPEETPGAGVERALCTLEVLGLLAPEAGQGYSEAEERDVIRRLKAFGYL